ncbi:Hypothetical_protein [Hexamita inflata]|uniref:Hypothetical_protein n=1 Tax=Hexamita inflata TaxID=28002 RepID=A0AA86UUX6_9EUKA|nr:Hypothetical protein HINF_LOCUS53447 [Hexamita inflata]
MQNKYIFNLQVITPFNQLPAGSEEERPTISSRVIKANINQFTQNNFINASNSVNTDLHTHHHTLDADMNTTGFIKERTNEHVCEFVDNIDKYFWDVLRLNTKDDIKQHYFQTQFKL